MSALPDVGTALARDPVLPQRDALLDPEASAERLRAVVGRRGATGRVRTLRARYQPGRSLRVTQVLAGSRREATSGAMPPLPTLPATGTATVVSTRGVAAAAFDRLVAASGAAPGTSVTADPATASVSWVFPHDRRLAALPDVWHRTGPARSALGGAWAATALAALAPEKAATLRCVDRDGRTLAFAKVYATAEAAVGAADRVVLAAGMDDPDRQAGPGAGPAAGPGVEARAGTPGGTPAGSVPAVLAVLPEQCTVLLGPVDGRPLSALPPAELPAALDAMAATLARLHAVDPGPLPALHRFTAPSLAAAAAVVTAGRPDLGALADDVAAALAQEVPAGPVALVHGDAHLPNGLLGPAGVALIDLDEAAAGHPAADVAGVLAGLRRARLAGALPPEREHGLASRFLAAYARAAGRPLEDDALAWHLGAALLVEGAARGVRRLQPVTLAALDRLLRDAGDLARRRAAALLHDGSGRRWPPW